MRAEEFLCEKTVFDKSIEQTLIQKGYKKLGQGSDQMAFLEPGTGFALKIFGTEENSKSGFTKSHNLFFKWAKFCMKNSNNPFLPKFDGYESFVYNGQTYLQIRQELLKPGGLLSNAVSQIGDEAEHADFTWQQFKEAYSDTDIANIINRTLTDQQAQLLVTTIQKLWKISEQQGYLWDFRGVNIMSRNGIPVIVDPWAVDDIDWSRAGFL